MKTIGNVAYFLSGGTPRKGNSEYWGGDIPWYSAANLSTKYLSGTDTTITQAGLEVGSRIAPKSSTLILVRGSGLFNFIPICFAERDVAFNQDVKAMVPSEDVDPLFFHYWIESLRSTLIENIEVTGIGAGKFDTDFLKSLPFPDTPLSEQIRIGIFASSFDKKIELNRKTSATLEEMARALYRSWFVDFDPVHAKAAGRAPVHMDAKTASLFPDSFGDDGLPKGWEAGTLADISLLNPSKHSKKKHPAQIEYVDLANTKWGLIEATTAYQWEDAPSRARMSLAAGDTIVGTVRPGNGSFSFVSKNDLTGSTGFAVLRPKYDRDASLIYLAATDQATIEVLTNLADGGAYPAVRPEVVSARKIVLAPDDLLLAFSQKVFPLIAKIEVGKDENQTLAALCDTLLPRLMSGELRLGEAREQVEEYV